ncbi:hypothetical protein LZ30DRAFT_742281 [Colletotrichum cereale]|nr:hypothetical protein LZ30DRAFT_742281 [Colletotrichum cereale]
MPNFYPSPHHSPTAAMAREGEAPGSICQILCLSWDGYESVTCTKRGEYGDHAQRIQTRFDHIRAVRSNDNDKLRDVNKLYRWLFAEGVFDSERFASALKHSQECDWVCCEGPAADQNTASGRRAAARAWRVSEECLTTFFGHDVSGNTWREISKFAKEAPVWERAQPALVAAREQRLNEARLNKRLSQTKTWTPFDPKKASQLYEGENGKGLDPAGHVDDRRDASENMSVRVTESAGRTGFNRERGSSSNSVVHATAESATDTIVVSSRPRADSHSSAQDRRAKRPRSPDTATQHPAPKRQPDLLASTSADEPRNILDAESLQSIQFGHGLPSDVIYAALHIVECAVGAKVVVVDPATPQAYCRFAGSPGTHHLIPLCHEGHWVLGVLGANQEVLRVYDPQPSLANRKAIKDKVAISSAPSPPPEVKFTAPLLQDAEEDSGVLLIVSALYVTLGRQVPQDVDPTLWREVLRVLLMPLSAQETVLAHTYVLEQPLVLESHHEKISVPGGSINVGEISTTLTPAEVLALLDVLHAEALATCQRVDTAAISASSVLDVVTALRNFAEARCQQEGGNIGVDVIGSLIRLNRLKGACEEARECMKEVQVTLSKILGRLSAKANSVF